jgi:hypothetical protein
MTISELLQGSLSGALGQTETQVKTEVTEEVSPSSAFSSMEVKKLSSFLEEFASNYGELVITLEKDAGPIHSFRKFRNRDVDLTDKTPAEIQQMSKEISPGKSKSIEKMMRTNKKIERSLSRAKALGGVGGMLGLNSKTLLLTGLGAGIGGAFLGSHLQREKDIRDVQSYSQGGGVV